MAELSGFLPSIANDNAQGYEFLAAWIAAIVSNGTYNAELQTRADENMTVVLPEGRAWINGIYYENTTPLKKTLAHADGVLARIDSIVLCLDFTVRKISSKLLQGVYSMRPVPPSLTRTANVWELRLANISVDAGKIAITQADIDTACILDNEQCGIVHCIVDKIETSKLYNQIKADLERFQKECDKEFTEWSAQHSQMIKRLQEAIEQTLSGALPDGSVTTPKFAPGAVAPAAANGVWNYTHAKSEGTHTLTGTGENGKFKATASGEVTAFTIAQTVYPVKLGDEPYIELVAGSWYSFSLDGAAVNFSQGGTPLNFKIIGGTAQPQAPRENTIWVNTALDIPANGYIFSQAQPTEEIATGTVWVKTGTEENISLNALKRGAIALRITSVLQWNGAKFVFKNAGIYQENAWKDIRKWFYHRGVNSLGSLVNASTVSHAFEVSRLRITRRTDSYDPYVYSSPGFDVTPFKTIHFIGLTPAGQTASGVLGVGTNMYDPAAKLYFKTDGAEKLFSLDVSAMTGSVAFGFTTTGGANTSAYFYEIYGEYL